MLVRGEDLDRLAGVLRGLLGNGVRELFLNAAASSGVADFGFFGRGFWIDQPIAFKASQPRCGATDMRPSSPAIQVATLRLDHSPPSGGGSRRRSAQLRQKIGLQDRCRCAVAAAQIAESLRSLGVVTGEQLFDPSLAKGRRRRHLRNGVTTRQKPDHLEMPRRRGVLTSQRTALPAPPHSNARRPSPCVQSPNSWRSRLSASQGRVNPPSTSSQSAGNRITPVICSSGFGMLPAFACNCAAEELIPKAHVLPRPR